MFDKHGVEELSASIDHYTTYILHMKALASVFTGMIRGALNTGGK